MEIQNEIVDISENAKSICAVWDFRANEDIIIVESFLSFLQNNCKKYVFQKEKGDSGYIHWQGRFSLIKKRNKSQLIKLFNSNNLLLPNYLMPTCKNNHTDDFFYAFKADTRIGEVYADAQHAQRFQLSTDGIYIPKQFRNINFYPYQQAIVDSRDSFDFRQINVIFDSIGNSGKSTIAAISEILYGAIDMPVLMDYKEIVATICNICMDTGNRSPKLVFFDMPRAQSKQQMLGFYSAIEQIKKGKLYDTRYKYKSFWIDSPTIWVFTNELPDTNLLSNDRWKIWTITTDKELKPYTMYFSPTPSDDTQIIDGVKESVEELMMRTPREFRNP